MLDETQPDEQWFAYVCHLDPCARCYSEGYRQPKDGCADCDDWTDATVWPKIAPALGLVIQPMYLQGQIEKAVTIPSEWALVRRVNFCIWTETHQVWIPPDRLAPCVVDEVSADNAALHPCAAGLDPSSTLDLTALVVAIRHDDPPEVAAAADPPAKVDIDGKDEYGQRIRLAFTLNFYVELIPFFWVPEETVLERVRTERIPYDVWARAGHLRTTPGPAIDHQAIYEFLVTDAKPRFRIQRLGMDENSGRFLFLKLRDEGRLRDDLIAVGQGKKLSEAFKFLEILVAHRRLRIARNPVLLWNFANAEPQRDRLGALWMEKPSQTKRIDGVVAAAMAIKELMALPAQRKRQVAALVV